MHAWRVRSCGTEGSPCRATYSGDAHTILRFFEQQARVDARVGHLAEADANIEPFFLQAHRPVGQLQLDLDRGIARDERRHRRRDRAPRPKPNDAFTRKQTGRLAAALRDELLQFRQFVEDARAVRQSTARPPASGSDAAWCDSSSRTPRRRSSCASRLLTAGGVTPSSRAAAARLRCRATSEKRFRSEKPSISMLHSFEQIRS